MTAPSASQPTQSDHTATPEARKPRLRGWLHAATFPVVVITGVLLVATATNQDGRIASAVFVATAIGLFGTSALFHLGSWTPREHKLLRRLDHSNIYLLIAGTYTPLAVVGMPDRSGTTLLLIVWTGAVLGLIFRLFWLSAPRWLYTALFIAIGWIAVFFIPELVEVAGVGPVLLLFVGGILYTLGAITYALKKPDPAPEWFGYHEVFHSLTIAAFTVHFIAVWLVVHIR